jgi:GNAT superfamily N-acetyltransferase
MSEKNKEKRNVVFRRIGGRIVPIAVGTAGAVVAADAARTRVVYKTKNLTMVRKEGVFLPIASFSERRPAFGTGLYAYNKSGKYVGRTLFDVTKEGKTSYGSIDWLGVKKKFRGKGVSKKMVRQAAVEMKSKGAGSIFSHVVSPRSAGLFEGSKVKSVYWKETGRGYLEQVSKKEAMARVNKWSKPMKVGELASRWSRPKNILKDIKSSIKNFNKKENYGFAKPIFRDVKLPKNLKRLSKPYMPTSAKLRLGVGSLLAIGSLAYGLGED